MNKYIIDKYVDKYIEKMIMDGNVSKIYPSEICNELEISLSKTFERLLELSKDDRLELKFDVKCSNCNEIDEYDTDVDFNQLTCFKCETKFEPKTYDIFPYFIIKDEYYTQFVMEQQSKKENDKFKRLVINKNKMLDELMCDIDYLLEFDEQINKNVLEGIKNKIEEIYLLGHKL